MPPIGCQGTYLWSEVVAIALNQVHGIPVSVLQVYACDQVNSIVHKTFPWRWTLLALTPITLTNGNQDYASVPANFYRMLNPRIVRTDVSPAQNQPIKIAKHLEVEVQRQGGINTIQSVSYEPSINSFRLDIPPSISGGTVLTLAGDYQNLPTKIAALTTAICPPDSYFNVLVEGVLWMFYRLADDPRAGQVSINRAGDKQYSGQLGAFNDALETMKRNEDTADEVQTRFPEEALGNSKSANSSIFPTV